MRQIWKICVDHAGPYQMPKGAEFVAVHEQDGKPHAWFLCNPKAEVVERVIYVVGTGWALKDKDAGAYMGTAFCGALVWHLFDKGEVSVPVA